MFTSVAFGGGGVRGGLHIGALAALEKYRGNLDFPAGVYGCSIGSIIATAVAFGLRSTHLREIFDNQFNDISNVIPNLRLTHVGDLTSQKGLFSMDMLETAVVSAFDAHGVDLRNKVISDAPQKLHIVAANMTTQTTTVFTGQVPILDAIKSSCCLPFVFHPQVIYNHVYLDGGLFVDNLASIVPEDCLVFHISPTSDKIYASELESMPLSKFLYSVYRSMRTSRPAPNMVWLENDTVGLLQKLTPEDRQLLYDQGYEGTSRFLSKRLLQKGE